MKQKAMSRLWSIPRKIYSETKPPLDEIYHHGIKGQKWGMKNGPPYPIQPDVAASKIRERAEKEVTKISNDVSQDAKTKKIPLYEERRTPGISKERALALEKQMEALANKVPDPKDIYKIKSHL